MIKQLAIYRLASVCDISSPWRAFLPTGADVITEEIYEVNGITDEYGESIELVYSGLVYILGFGFPIIGIFSFVAWRIFIYKNLSKYFIPLVLPDCSDFLKFLYSVFPFILYIKLCLNN